MPDVVIPGAIHNIPAYIAGGEEPRRGAVILIHEVWGLNKNIRGLADRLASEGYLVVAPELIEHTGITKKIDQTIMAEVANPATRDEAQKKMREAMTPLRSPEFGKETVESLRACFEYIKSEHKAEKIAVMGFCFGGT
jgi:carboxymethylenebutenolidase